jgi:uncharacterized protein YjbI with pentapeptide repeats
MDLRANEEFSEIIVNKADYSSQTLSKIRVSSSKFTNVALAGSDISYSSFFLTDFKDCNLTGTQFIRNTLEAVVFADCKFELTSFMFSHLKDVVFKNCNLNEIDFRDTILENVTFKDDMLENIDFSGANVKGNLDISASRVISLKGIMKLKGMVISEEQLLSLSPFMANELGFVVKVDNSVSSL